LIFAVWIVFVVGRVSAETNVWQPSRGYTQMPIWPGAVPNAGKHLSAFSAAERIDFLANVPRQLTAVRDGEQVRFIVAERHDV